MSIDQELIESTVHQYYKEIYAYCFSRLINKNNVEDIVQNVFVMLQEKSDELTSENLRAWLYSVAQKKLMEEKREEVRRSRFVSYDVEVIAKDPILTYEVVEERASDDDIEVLKRRILKTLTPEEQTLFEAIYEKHIKRKEIALQLNITENALNVRVCRMKKHIKSLVHSAMVVLIFIFVKCRLR